MKKAPVYLIIVFLGLSIAGCGKSTGFHTLDIPKEMAKPEDLDDKPFANGEPVHAAGAVSNTATTSTADLSEFSTNEVETTNQSSIQSSSANAATVKSSVWKSVVDTAKWVMQYESSKVGTRCNFFIQRIFEHLGIGKSSWIANDFDRYVRANFTSYKVISIGGSATASMKAVNRNRLHNYLWSFPEGTGFVLQWKRPNHHGHVALVQRIQNNLVIYHASLNQFRPKSQSVTVDTLLSTSGSTSSLNVFSDFEKPTRK